MRPNFTATYNKGFRMKFQNGFAVSVQWGTGNYCEKKNLGAEHDQEMKEKFWQSQTAEVAVFEDSERLINISSDGVDEVIGWLTPNDVAKIIEIVSGYQGQTMTGMSGERYIQTEIKKLGL